MADFPAAVGNAVTNAAGQMVGNVVANAAGQVVGDVVGAASNVMAELTAGLPSPIMDLVTFGTGALATILATMGQFERPISLLLMDKGEPVWGHWVQPRPEDMTYRHPSRASAIHTLGGAYLDDFGEGIVEISMQATTGYKMGLIGAAAGRLSGDAAMFNLREYVMVEFHRLREAAAADGGDPEEIQLHLVDTLNNAYWVVYPMDFQLRRSNRSPLLYRYIIRLVGLQRLA